MTDVPIIYGPSFAPVLLIGEAPSRTQERPEHVLVHKRLIAATGLELAAYYRCFMRTDLLPEWPGRDGAGSAFNLSNARVAARQLLGTDCTYGRRVVLLGRRVADACYCGEREWFVEKPDERGGTITVVPHPSGLSRWWHDRANAKRGGDYWRTLGAWAMIAQRERQAVDHLASKLGLMAPTDGPRRPQAAQTLFEPLELRGTGRSTTIVLRGLLRMSEGRTVWFAAPTLHRAEFMRGLARGWAARLGIPAARLGRATRLETARFDVAGRANVDVLLDHDARQTGWDAAPLDLLAAVDP